MLVIAYAVRRLPYALSAAGAALRQLHVSLEEAAENLGAGKLGTLTRIVVPLMTGGLLAGFVTSFATAAVELSATLILVARSADAPLAYGIYVYMQSAAGRGPGAALGVVAVVVVAIATFIAYRIAERERGLQVARVILMSREVVIDHVSFGYGATPVLDDVTLAVAPGEFFAFLGPSGSGKTTLLRLIAGFGTPASGRILIGGRDVTRLAAVDAQRRHGVPELRAVAAHERRRQRRVRPGAQKAPRADVTRRRCAPCSSWSASPHSPIGGRRSSPAASSSASRSPARW